MPLEPPKLLDRHMPCGVIHEHTLNASGVPVEGEVLHLMPGTLPIAVVVAGHELVGAAVVWPASAPHHVHKHRYVVQVMAGGIDRAPGPSEFWHGRIDELAIFNHAIDAKTIRQLFETSDSELKSRARASLASGLVNGRGRPGQRVDRRRR